MPGEVKAKVSKSLAVVKHHQLSAPVREDIKVPSHLYHLPLSLL